MRSDWYKDEPASRIWRIDDLDRNGTFLFSFDKKTILNFWEDYNKLTPEQKAIFDKEFPTMASLK